ncbi:MAG: hypothetical protein FWH03_05590 [Firmicutes bacterium]|nr:hypothetical protein [Bacillota bacterium]
MSKALVVIDIQNDITKNYKDIIGNINSAAIDWAVQSGIHVFTLGTKGYTVNILSDCIASWNKKQIPEMLLYYEKQGSKIISLNKLIS